MLKDQKCLISLFQMIGQKLCDAGFNPSIQIPAKQTTAYDLKVNVYKITLLHNYGEVLVGAKLACFGHYVGWF